jgi:hypothetical protein
VKVAHEGLEIAERCEYRLIQAEIQLFLAHLHLDKGDKEMTRQHGEKARDLAICDGEPYGYKVVLEQARNILTTLSE